MDCSKSCVVCRVGVGWVAAIRAITLRSPADCSLPYNCQTAISLAITAQLSPQQLDNCWNMEIYPHWLPAINQKWYLLIT